MMEFINGIWASYFAEGKWPLTIFVLIIVGLVAIKVIPTLLEMAKFSFYIFRIILYAIVFVLLLFTWPFFAIDSLLRPSKYKSDKMTPYEALMDSPSEREVAKAIQTVKSVRHIFRNVFLYNGHNIQEIDVVAVSDHAVYVTEVKDYSGIITPEDGFYWKQRHSGYDEPKLFYSPARQNDAHVSLLRELLSQEVPSALQDFSIKPMVVFTSKSLLEGPEFIGEEWVGKVSNVAKYVQKIERGLSKTNNGNDLDAICRFFDKYTNVSDEIKEKHLQNAKKQGEKIK